MLTRAKRTHIDFSASRIVNDLAQFNNVRVCAFFEDGNFPPYFLLIFFVLREVGNLPQVVKTTSHMLLAITAE